MAQRSKLQRRRLEEKRRHVGRRPPPWPPNAPFTMAVLAVMSVYCLWDAVVKYPRVASRATHYRSAEGCYPYTGRSSASGCTYAKGAVVRHFYFGGTSRMYLVHLITDSGYEGTVELNDTDWLVVHKADYPEVQFWQGVPTALRDRGHTMVTWASPLHGLHEANISLVLDLSVFVLAIVLPVGMLTDRRRPARPRRFDEQSAHKVDISSSRN